MTCSELRDHFELYVLGLAEEPERSEIRAHLDRGCEVCMAEVKRAREMAAMLASTAAPLAPSPKLRRRILAAAGAPSYGFGWAPAFAGVAVLSLCAAVYFSGREREFSRGSPDSAGTGPHAEHRAHAPQRCVCHSEWRRYYRHLLRGEAAQTQGRVFCNPSLGVLLIASNLPHGATRQGV